MGSIVVFFGWAWPQVSKKFAKLFHFLSRSAKSDPNLVRNWYPGPGLWFQAHAQLPLGYDLAGRGVRGEFELNFLLTLFRQKKIKTYLIFFISLVLLSYSSLSYSMIINDNNAFAKNDLFQNKEIRGQFIKK